MGGSALLLCRFKRRQSATWWHSSGQRTPSLLRNSCKQSLRLGNHSARLSISALQIIKWKHVTGLRSSSLNHMNHILHWTPKEQNGVSCVFLAYLSGSYFMSGFLLFTFFFLVFGPTCGMFFTDLNYSTILENPCWAPFELELKEIPNILQWHLVL